jgi:rod shape-determining protein MreC
VRNFFGSTKFKIFAVIGCLLIGLMLRSASTGDLPTVTQNVVSVIMSPFETASSYVSGIFSGFIGDVFSLGSLKTENDKLKGQITTLQKQLVTLNDIKQKYDRIKGLVDLPDEGDHRKYVPAAVISHDSGQWFSAFTIDEGSLSGVKVHDPVITEEGLVGIVVSTELNTSIVSTVLDPSVHVGATVSQTGDTGLTAGDSDLYANGEFDLTNLGTNSSVTAGDIIITTGRNGTYPKNICIGTVQSVGQDPSGSSLTAVCRPMVDPAAVKDVFVITNFTGKQTISPSGSSKGGK